jgi:hypothetical protein
MKKLMFILLIMTILLALSIQASGQVSNEPAIYQIDKLEKTINNENWLDNFSAFVIGEWLYALSYQPNVPENECNDNYRNAYVYYRNDKNDVWLYRKNIMKNGQWELANNNPVFRNILAENDNGDGISFCSKKSEKNKIIKLVAYKNFVFIICTVKNNSKLKNQFLLLSPEETYGNGSIYFNIDKFECFTYPVKFTGQINNGKTITTIDNKGNLKNIYIYLGGKDLNGNLLSNKHISFDGDYGYRLFYPSEHMK